MKKMLLNPFVMAFLAFVSMGAFYYGLLWLTTGDVLHPLFFFVQKWYFLAPIFLGFSYQMFLFQKLRIMIRKSQVKMAAMSAGTNGLAMAACCAHHIAEILPFIGFTGAAAGITRYQDVFLAVGVLVNGIGVWYMWSRIQKQKRMHCALV